MMEKNTITEQAAHHGFLAEALLELRELVESGSEEMGIIDEALGKVGITPWKAYHPCGRCVIDEECPHCRSCGGVETDPDGLCEMCEKCSLCCEDGTFFGDNDDDAYRERVTYGTFVADD